MEKIEKLKHYLEAQLKHYTPDLGHRLYYIEDDCKNLQERLDDNRPLGLGGSLQNTWEIYRLMGLVEAYRDLLNFLEKNGS